MRIVGGTHRGTPLTAPKGDRTRPTSDRLRESVFNILLHRFGGSLEGARVLDLYAGTGALGLEALSRGAAFALFVETAADARAVIRTNAEAMGVTGRTRVWRRDAAKPGACPVAPFDLVFADPPYGRGLGEAALAAVRSAGWLKPGATAVVEERAGKVPEAIAGWQRLDARTIGDSAIGIFAADAAPA
jgi:16S rRNA (guanine966-N2)-methyltransferase